MRKLATIQRIKTVEPVITASGDEATSLQFVTFEDIAWGCVVKRGEFAPGDLAVYIEISTVVPEHPVFEFLRAKKFKVKTQKFVGTTVSQGLALPVGILAQFGMPFVGIGDDVSDIIGVKRFDPELDSIKVGGEVAGPFPEHLVPKTDQERIQSAPYLLERMKGLSVVATLKYDGTSATYFWADGRLHACSRNLEQKPDNGSVYWKVAEKYKLAELLEKHPTLVIQGEIVGPKIQNNRLGLNEHELWIFNMWSRRDNCFIIYANMRLWCQKHNLNCVEAIYVWQEGEFDETVDSLLQLAVGNYAGTNNPREGLVLRPMWEVIFEPRIGRQLSFKVINNDYLLKGGE